MAVGARLDAHQRRREASVPCVSTLVGDQAAALRAVRDWARSRQRAVIVAGEAGLVRRMARYLLAHEAVQAASGALLAAETGYSEPTLLWQLETAERWLVERQIRDKGELQSFALDIFMRAVQLGAESKSAQQDLRILGAICHLAPPAVLPCLLVPIVEGAEGALLREAVSVSEAIPLAPIAVVMSPSTWRVATGRLGGSRVSAILEEGSIDVPPQDVGALAGCREVISAREVGVTAGSATDLRMATVALSEAGADHEATSTARSKIEAAFYELLQERPATVGRFEMNAKLDVRHGAKPAEVDFLARDFAIAIELDGYHHFGGPEAYRRDRRKDLLLQKEGYLVMRFLADDVYEQLADILRTIEDAIRWRTKTGGSAK